MEQPRIFFFFLITGREGTKWQIMESSYEK